MNRQYITHTQSSLRLIKIRDDDNYNTPIRMGKSKDKTSLTANIRQYYITIMIFNENVTQSNRYF
jgi:hypothetical protein